MICAGYLGGNFMRWVVMVVGFCGVMVVGFVMLPADDVDPWEFRVSGWEAWRTDPDAPKSI